MSAANQPFDDELRELRYALIEADAEAPPDGLRSRVMRAALAARPAAAPLQPPEHISGAEAFRRTVDRLHTLLGDLRPAEWSKPALRDLDIQGLVGHLIGVETAFVACLEGLAEAGGGDHVTTTQPTAVAQSGRPPGETHRDWLDKVSRTLAFIDQRDADRRDPVDPMTFYGITLPLDQLLVVRSFEMWIHTEDILRAARRPVAAVDPAHLARMAGLAVALLPAGMARAERRWPDRTIRLVLTGPGGGTWDVELDGSAVGEPGAHDPPDTRIVVDTVSFCRVVGDRTDQAGAGAIVIGDQELAADVFAGAAALALD